MNVKEVVQQEMTKGAVTVHPDNHLFHAYALMQRCGIRHLPVIEDGELVGILSDRDLYRHGFLCEEKDGAGSRLVKDAMTRGVRTCRLVDGLADVADAMVRDHIDALPVVNDAGALLGIITSTDLLRHFRRRENALDASAQEPGWELHLGGRDL